MADGPAFLALCDALESSTSLDRLESRGTVRLALKQAGLDPAGASPAQLAVVVEKVLPAELESRGVDPGITASLARMLNGMTDPSTTSVESPEEVFSRIR